MYAGLSRYEQNMILGLLFCAILMGAVIGLHDRRPPVMPEIHGPAIHHPPGVLSLSTRQASEESLDSGHLRDGRVNLNTAPAEILAAALPGIGPARSEAIVQFRERHGPFASVADLEKVSGIGPRTMETLTPLLFVEPIEGEVTDLDPFRDRWMADSAQPAPTPRVGVTTPNLPRPVNINTASAEELQTLPGIGPAISQRIIEDRHLRGPYGTVNDLQRVSGIGPRTLENLRPWITVSSPPPR